MSGEEERKLYYVERLVAYNDDVLYTVYATIHGHFISLYGPFAHENDKEMAELARKRLALEESGFSVLNLNAQNATIEGAVQ